MTQRKQLIPDIEFSNFPFGLVKKLFDEKKICINNEYQRADVWKQTQKVELIESIHNAYSIGVLVLLKNTNKEIIDISIGQLNHFAGNMLQVKNAGNELLLVMSSRAYQSLNKIQVKALEKHNRIIHSSLNIIETAGGGSARCMMAEVFLERK